MMQLSLTAQFFILAGSMTLTCIIVMLIIRRWPRLALLTHLAQILGSAAAGYLSFASGTAASGILLFCSLITLVFFILYRSMAFVEFRRANVPATARKMPVSLGFELGMLIIVSGIFSYLGVALAGGPASVLSVIGVIAGGIAVLGLVAFIEIRRTEDPHARMKRKLIRRMNELNAQAGGKR